MTLELLKSRINDNKIYLYDSRSMPFDDGPLSHFALTDALLNEVGRQQKSMLHFWPARSVVFLGMQDTRLPYFKQALDVFDQAGYDYVVRNSGGLGVVSDSGITNISLLLANKDMSDISIDEGYELMYELVQEVIDVPIDAIEIKHSYCPGDFDLSIDGQKISGLSQRRRAGGLAIMLYLSVNGSQEKRSLMMKDFYQQGLQGETSRFNFPHINPAVMTTLSDALKKDIPTEQVEQAFIKKIKEQNIEIVEGPYSQAIMDDYSDQIKLLNKRNQRMLQQ